MFQQAKDKLKTVKDKLKKANKYRKHKENTVIKAKFTLMDVINSTVDYVGDIYQAAEHYWLVLFDLLRENPLRVPD